jgi:hypothetical protein
MTISRNATLGLLFVLLLVFGTQMPGAWRDAAFRVTRLPWQLTKVAHFVLFVSIVGLARTAPLRMSTARVARSAPSLPMNPARSFGRVHVSVRYCGKVSLVHAGIGFKLPKRAV